MRYGSDFLKGYEAYQKGKQLEDCPKSLTQDEAEDWRWGWWQAKDDDDEGVDFWEELEKVRF